jgi:hypothetical protein
VRRIRRSRGVRRVRWRMPRCGLITRPHLFKTGYAITSVPFLLTTLRAHFN